ncbi:mannan endo-1,4-beta-mannosidase, partial [bacterium]
MIVLACAVATLAPAIRLEAEAARLDGPQVATSRAGFSGTGYVTDITRPGARLSWKLRAKSGIYTVRIGYAAAQEKG